MSSLVALSLSIGLLGGVATFLYLKLGLAIWAGFLAWACFFHSGGDTKALQNTIVGNIFGAFCAWVAAMILATMPQESLGLAWPAIVVGVTVCAMCLAAHIKAFSVIPASVYGYAATFAFLLMKEGAMTSAQLTAMDFKGNALLLIAVSMTVGALFGLASGKLGGALTRKA
jgi:hypothetical protein